MPARSLGALVALLLALVLPTAALAGPPGQWTRISPTNQANIDEAGLARTADGVLHVFFGRHLGGLDNAVEQVAVSPAGHPGTATTVSGGWATLDGPGPVVGADGKTIDLFWGGQISGDPIHQELNYASSPNGGQSWTLSPFNLLVGEQVGMDDLSAARLGSTEYQAWSSYVHVGTVPGPGWHLSASPSASACCGYWASVAADAASGKVVAAWSSNQDGYPGAWAQYLDPVTGAPQGKPMRMPGSAVKYQGVLSSAQLLARTPLVAQTGGSKILMAYPHGYPGNHDAIVWVVGSPAFTYLARTRHDVNAIGLAAAPGGRMWAFWAVNGSSKLFARRSNASATRWGATVAVPLPRHTTDVWKLAGDGGLGPLDLVAGLGMGNPIAFWHTRVLPGLTLSAGPASLHRAKTTKVTFTVVDAGTPVKGAKVKVAGQSGTTDGSGHVTIALGPFGRRARGLSASASHAGYVSGAVHLRVTK